MLIDQPWAWLLAPLPLLVMLLAPRLSLPQTALWIPFMARLALAAEQRPEAKPVEHRTRLQRMMMVGVWLCALAALSRPQWLGEAVTEPVPIRDTLVAVDISGSMETEDMRMPEGDAESRLGAVKRLLAQLVHARSGDRFGLILFGSAPYLQVPFTRDSQLFLDLLADAEVRMAGPKTYLGDAVGLAIKHFEHSGQRQRVLLLVTDGNDSGSRMPPLEAARLAAQDEVQIHTLAIGDPATAGEAAIDLKALAAISEATDGQLMQARTGVEMDRVVEQLERLNPSEAIVTRHRPRLDLYHWPLAAALVMLFGVQGWLYWRNREQSDAD